MILGSILWLIEYHAKNISFTSLIEEIFEYSKALKDNVVESWDNDVF